MGGTMHLEQEQLDQVYEKLLRFGNEAGKTVSQALHDSAEVIQGEIHGLLPQSGRSWPKKRVAARSAAPGIVFRADFGDLFVTIRTRPNYNYLYFPDGGLNTRRHVGNQQFMLRGAEASASEVGQRVIQALVERFEQE